MPDGQRDVGCAQPSTHLGPGVCVQHLGPRPALVLRVLAADVTRAAMALRQAGLDLPLAPNTVRLGGVRLLWTGLGEWLLTTLGERLPDGTAIAAALEDIPHLLAEVTDGRTVVTLSGDQARTVLAKGCGLDLHPRAFTTGQCAQTLLARVPVLLFQTSDEPCFELFVDRSLAAYLRDWMAGAAAEFDGTAGA
ncbi:sarcosine oxidase subunit gamma [Nitrospirillum sp. BR 11163]|uniref:sarcosine oxidase subunit gamma n=1 Tax=Nitrospirillum sp. BR 11163 TaxID=3104323 RepID=UPI002AFFF2F0|nr:sarcosine oxidase subunit gamma family protein [Nitrospirillum sp. BR 11163]MEA1672719.1 sarcosine oxidase subunit gamma family protein [Nitrospirillum sp. BR 11163]